MEHPTQPPTVDQDLARDPKDDGPGPDTLAASTVAQYQKRGLRLWERAARELDLSPDTLTPAAFVDWLLSLMPCLAPSSRRAYRASAVYFLQGRPDADEPIAALRAITADLAEGGEEDDRERQGGHRAVKHISADDFDRLTKHLEYRTRSGYAPVLLHWCWAGLLTGLRPAEWEGASLHEEDPRRLIVQNAKATQGRAIGLTRTLLLHELADAHMVHVAAMIDLAAQVASDANRPFADVQKEAAALMARVCRRLWPTRKHQYSLYTFRHQFIAQAKAAYTPAEVAALAGHATDETASRHYGRRRFAWTGDAAPPLPAPSPADLQAVRHRLQLYEDRMARTRGSAPSSPTVPAPDDPPEA